MRIAVVSDIHGNLTALEAVIADLKKVSPDRIVQGGDLVSGSRSAEVVDRVRELGWPGVQGNAEEMLWNQARVDDYFRAPALQQWQKIVSANIAATLDAVGGERVSWLRTLPGRWSEGDLTVVHAGPDDFWRSPLATATDDELTSTYRVLGTRLVVYGHIHTPFVRSMGSLTVANSGSVGMPYDGDPRAAYLLLEDDRISIRRVEYDVESEVEALFRTKTPYAAWAAEMLRKGSPLPAPVDES